MSEEMSEVSSRSLLPMVMMMMMMMPNIARERAERQMSTLGRRPCMPSTHSPCHERYVRLGQACRESHARKGGYGNITGTILYSFPFRILSDCARALPDFFDDGLSWTVFVELVAAHFGLILPFFPGPAVPLIP